MWDTSCWGERDRKGDGITIFFAICSGSAFSLFFTLCHTCWWASSWSSSSESDNNYGNETNCSYHFSASFQYFHSIFATPRFASKMSADHIASNLVHLAFRKRCPSLNFFLKCQVGVGGRGGALSERIQDKGEDKSPSWCVVVMEGETVMVSLLRAS